MISRIIGASACAFVLLAAPAYATDKCVNPGGTGGCFTTIQAAHDDLTTVDGDTITVEQGTYAAPQTLVSKGVTIAGSVTGPTIVDGGVADTASSGTFRVTAATDVTIQDLMIRNPSGPAAARSGVAVKSPATATVTLQRLAIEGRANGDMGVWSDNSDADLEFANSSIRNVALNPMLLELHNGATDVHDSVIDGTSAIFFMTYGGKDVTEPQRVAGNTITSTGSGVSFSSALTASSDGRFSDVEVSGNTIESGTPANPASSGSGISLTNSRNTGDGAGGLISNALIEDNRLAWVGRPPNPVNTNSRGISISGRVEGTQITGNAVVGYGTALRAVNAGSGHGQSGTEAHFNQFAGQATAVNNATAGSIDAEHNWWGCNEGPGNADCGTVAGSGAVDFDPWLVLSASASPSSIQTGGQQSTVTAHLRTDSSGATPPGNAFPDPTTIEFSTDRGSIQPSADTTDASASAVLTSGADEGTANVTASLDNEAVGGSVTFTKAPAPAGTTVFVTTPGGQAETPAQTPLTLELVRARTARVNRRGDFIVTTNTTGRGVLVGKGTSRGGKAGRLRGQRKTSPGGRVRLRMRLGKAARQRLAAGGRVTARITVSLTPIGGGTPITRSMTVRLVRG
jgi:hypothetical protein